MSNNRVAALILGALALLVAGIMVETYWDCRLLKGGCLERVYARIGATDTKDPHH